MALSTSRTFVAALACPPQAVATAARRLGLPIAEQRRCWPTYDQAVQLRSGGTANRKVFGGGLGEPVLLKKGSTRKTGEESTSTSKSTKEDTLRGWVGGRG